VLTNILPTDELRGLASRKSKPDEYKSVRNPLVEEETSRGWKAVRHGATTTRLERPKRHDKRLEDRVWTLLYRMGFTHLSGQGGAHLLLAASEPEGPDNQIDVVAVDDEVAFAIECKSAETPRKFNDFSKDLAKHATLRQRFGHAIRSEIPGQSKRPTIFAFWTFNIIVTDNDQSRAEAANVTLLDQKDLEYYEILVDQIGTAARFQFLADILEGRAVSGLEIVVPAIRSKIAKITAYTFSVPPDYLLKIAFVSHRARGKASDIDAYQRLLKKGRLKSIRQYISDGGIFPTNIVVNVSDPRWLTFDRENKRQKLKAQPSVGYVSGQHIA
jgi:DNA sulfur modification protein DndB